MKRISAALILALSFLFLSSTHNEETITLPVTLKTGFGGMPASFGFIRLNNTTSTLSAFLQKKLSGLPDWTQLTPHEIIFDFNQRAYQDAITENPAKKPEGFETDKRLFSEKPVKCFAYAIVGKDKTGTIKYKIDSDNDLDFADEVEFDMVTLEKKHWKSLDSLVRKLVVNVRYQAFRNNQLTELSAPVMILKTPSGILQNIPQHAEVIFQGQKIIISSGFNSTNYSTENLKLAINPVFGQPYELINANEYLSIDGVIYQNLGVDINKQVLTLRKTKANEIIFSSQAGFYAKPFAAKEFSTLKDIALKDYTGKYVFVEFWGTWCGPCVAELPNLKKVYGDLDHSKIEFLGIASDRPEALKNFLNNEPIAWKQILCETEAEGIIADYNINSFPTSFLIDPNGKIVAKNLRGENLSDTLKYYLRQP